LSGDGHISWEELLAAADRALEVEEWRRAEAHLVQCAECELKWRKVQRLREAFWLDASVVPGREDCLEEDKLAAYLDERLPAEEAYGVQQHIQQCEECFSRLARACKAQASKPGREIVSTPAWLKKLAQAAAGPVPGRSRSIWSRFWRGLQEKLGGWLASPWPGYVLAGVLLALLLWPEGKRQTMQVVNLPQTTGLWVFPEAAVSFRGRGADRSMVLDESRVLHRELNFSGMKVQEKPGWGLIFTWPKMEGTQEYNFTLFVQDEQGKRVIVSVTTPEERYDFSYAKYGRLSPGRLYEWEVCGKYGAGLYFKAEAKFIIKMVEQESLATGKDLKR